MGHWLRPLSFIQFTNILKVQQSLNFCRKRTLNILQEGKYGVFGNIQKPLSAICTIFHSVYLKLPIKLIFIPYFQTAAHRMKLEEVSKYFHHGILYTSHWIHSHRRTNFGQKVVKKLKIPPISRTLKQCSVGQTVFCRRKKQKHLLLDTVLDGWFVVSSVTQSALFYICKDLKQLLASLQTWVASWCKIFWESQLWIIQELASEDMKKVSSVYVADFSFQSIFVTCGPIWMTLLWEGFAQTVASFYYYYFITWAVSAEECRKVGIFDRIMVTERRTVVGSVTSHLH